MIYLLHFSRPVAHAGHYLGYTKSHRAGVGSPLVFSVVSRGGDFAEVRLWPEGTRTLERQLKNRGRLWELCPVCRAAGRTRPYRIREAS